MTAASPHGLGRDLSAQARHQQLPQPAHMWLSVAVKVRRHCQAARSLPAFGWVAVRPDYGWLHQYRLSAQHVSVKV